MKKALLALLSIGIAFTAMQPAQACPSTDTPAPVVSAPAPVAAPVVSASAPIAAPVVQTPVPAPVVTKPATIETVTQEPVALLSQPAQAQDEKVLAIIDTAINSTKFNSIIHEVCFTTVKNMSCPNGELFMEGKGAASATWPTSINNGTYHGDAMAKAAIATSPNIKIVFIRVYNVSSLGNSSTPSDGSTIIKALDWVNNNASKYSIDAISISLSGINTATKSLHIGCTNPAILNLFQNQVEILNLKNVPTFAATGNNSLTNIVGFPACVPGVIGVGALGNETQLEKATNTGPGLDMVARSRVAITKYNGSSINTSGTSAAAVVSAASYVNRNTFKTFGEYLTSLSKILINNVSYIRN
jgi:hypothetical protein